MRPVRSAITCALATTMAIGTASNAFAACAGINGIWHVFLMEGDVAFTTTTSVRKGDDSGPMNIKVFQNNPHSSATSLAIKCKLQVSNTGAFSNDPCTSYGIVAGDGGAVTVSGQLNFAANPACQISGGTLTISGEPTPVTFLGGYVRTANGHGAGIARQGAGSVFLFNMVKQ